MNVVDLIRRKRDGKALDANSIDWLVQSYTHGKEVADYQMSAFLMAVVCRGMRNRETVALTRSMLSSGKELRVRDHDGTRARPYRRHCR